MRLHVWPVAASLASEALAMPHTHSSPLWSFILTGAVENLAWDRDDSAASNPLATASIQHNPVGERSSIASDPVALRIRGRALYGPGSIYFVPQGVFHSSRTPLDAPCATVVLRGAKTHASVVVGLTEMGRHPERPQTFLSPIEALALARIDWKGFAG